MKKYAFRGFIIFFVSSLVLNLSTILLLNEDAETLALNAFHILPTLVFNEIMESIIGPSFIDVLLLVPIALTDGLIGLFIGLFLGKTLRNKRKEKYFFILTFILFVVFQYIIISFVPPFSN